MKALESSRTPTRGFRRVLVLIAGAPRLVVLAILFAVLLGVFIGRLYQLQVVEARYWNDRAEEQRARQERLPASRGIIYSREGEPLVRNVPSFRVVVVPALLPEDEIEREAMLRRLAEMLDVVYERPEGESDSPPGLLEKVEEASDSAPYEQLVVAQRVDRGTALTIAQDHLRMPGVEIEVSSRRRYPYGSLVAPVIGYLGAIPEGEDEIYRMRGYDPAVLGDVIRVGLISEDEIYRMRGYDPAVDRIGYAGVEDGFEDWLHGEPGMRYQEEDVLGRVVRVLGEEEPPVPGHNVHLTLDLGLQQVAQDALWEAMTRPAVNSRRGVVVAMDPRTGEILAMVSLPSYDNNLFAQGISQEDYNRLLEDPHDPLVNHAVSDQLPPGSIFKIVPAAGALEEGVVDPDTRLECPGTIVVPNKYYPNDPGRAQPFHCWQLSGHGWLNIVDGLAHSCDVFFYKVGGGFEEEEFEGLGPAVMGDYARLFGLGETTGIELPLEAEGLVPTQRWKRLTIGENWSTGDTYNLSIGQGYLLVTPLQMANLMATTANGGTLYQPQIVHHITDAEGNVVQAFEPEIRRTLPISPANWTLIHQGLEGAVVYGTATNGQVEGVRVAGKTGTAQFCDNIAQQMGICGEGLAQPTHAWYMAFAPIENPEIALVIFIYNGGEGSAAAVPVGQEILDWYFHRAP